MAQDPYRYFRVEARDLLDQFAKGILEIEKGGNSAAAVQRLLRLAHTLKGAARVVKQPGIADRAHAIEDALTPFRDGAQSLARAEIDTVLAHLDEIDGQIVTLAPADAESRPGQVQSAADEPARTIRTDVAETEAVLDGVAETHALLNGLRGAGREMAQAEHLADLLAAQVTSHRAPITAAGHGRPSSGRPEALVATADELRRKLGGVGRKIGAAVGQMDRELRQLRDAAERLRLASAATLFTALERTARDTARALGKQVTFAAGGGDMRLDSHILETVHSALIQLVRNAVAHGIELEGERKIAGKPAAGRVTVNVARRGRHIAFSCSDDGRGVDIDAVRQVASQRGFAGATSRETDARDVVRMLLRGGISTARTVTDLSGRGIGLDVVREAAELLGGEVVVRTDAGIGTTFELVVPPSLSAIDALLVEAHAGGSVTAIPLDAVRSTLRLAAADISRAASGTSISCDQQRLAFIPLTATLEGARWSADRDWTAIIVAAPAGMAAIGVDRLLGTAKIVVHPLPKDLPVSPVVTGVSLDADSNPQLVLDAGGLVAAAHDGSGTTADAAPPRRLVLVVDDSLTTRMLEQSILESAGYEVEVALSGEEALELVPRKPYALVLVDVEMPGIDGFTFIERMRAQPALRDIPAILVTSRAAPEDRRRGRDVGAQGYIVKSAFDQAELLATIRSLVG
jgi:two-component system, chemotaxis family, sensor kinase CheA